MIEPSDQERAGLPDTTAIYLEELEAEVTKLSAQRRHCDNCGGTWLDDGINGKCLCEEIAMLRDDLAQAHRLIKRLTDGMCDATNIPESE